MNKKLYSTFKRCLHTQSSWTKWHLMQRFDIDYTTAEIILHQAVKDNLVELENYYHQFKVIKFKGFYSGCKTMKQERGRNSFEWSIS